MRQIDADNLIERIKAAPIREKNKVIGLIHTERTAPVKTGKWIEDNDPNADPLFRKGWKCSVCGSRTSYGTPPYCMRCGAKMEANDEQL